MVEIMYSLGAHALKNICRGGFHDEENGKEETKKHLQQRFIISHISLFYLLPFSSAPSVPASLLSPDPLAAPLEEPRDDAAPAEGDGSENALLSHGDGVAWSIPLLKRVCRCLDKSPLLPVPRGDPAPPPEASDDGATEIGVGMTMSSPSPPTAAPAAAASSASKVKPPPPPPRRPRRRPRRQQQRAHLPTTKKRRRAPPTLDLGAGCRPRRGPPAGAPAAAAVGTGSRPTWMAAASGSGDAPPAAALGSCPPVPRRPPPGHRCRTWGAARDWRAAARCQQQARPPAPSLKFMCPISNPSVSQSVWPSRRGPSLILSRAPPPSFLRSDPMSTAGTYMGWGVTKE